MIRVRALSGLSIIVVLLVSATPAWAYVDPAVGTGLVASALGMMAGLFMLFFGAIWYPIKRLFKFLRNLFISADQ
jgi:hypothetical protein